MKKLWVLPILALLLVGCGSEKTLETVGDVEETPVVATMQRVLLQLPEELSSPVLQSEKTGTLYICDDYSVTVQTVSAGDLNKTIHNATGMDREDLQIMQTEENGIKRYRWVWSTGGENGIQVGKGCILDDGTYHYVLTALADEKAAARVQPAWQEMFGSFRLAQEREQISTGS